MTVDDYDTIRGARDLIIFRIGRQEFCLAADEVLEVSRMVPFAVPPDDVPQVVGVVTFRGEVVPVLDLYEALHQRCHGSLIELALLFVRLRGRREALALMVDEIVDMAAEPERDSHSEGDAASAWLDTSAVRFGDRLVFRLDLEQLLPARFHRWQHAEETKAFAPDAPTASMP